MKAHILFLFFVSSFFLSTFAQLDCSKYYQLKEGLKYELQIFDKKDKLDGVVKYHVTNASNSKATLNTVFIDKKGEEVFASEYDVLCKDNGITIDFKSLMNGDFMKQYKDMEIEMTGTNLDLPNDLSFGQSLPDANMNATINMAPMKMKMNIKMINRKVEGKEKVTTPAGTFECYIITYTTEFKMGLKRTGMSKQWIAEGIGLVKSEEYNKKGKRISYSILSSIN